MGAIEITPSSAAFPVLAIHHEALQAAVGYDFDDLNPRQAVFVAVRKSSRVNWNGTRGAQRLSSFPKRCSQVEAN